MFRPSLKISLKIIQIKQFQTLQKALNIFILDFQLYEQVNQIEIYSSLCSILSDSYLSKSQSKHLSIESFTFLKTLGKGSYGVFYLVQQNKSRLIFALKKIQKTKIVKQPKGIELLINQIKIQSTLNHRNISKIYGYFSDSKFIYLILQYCGQITLFDFFKDKNNLLPPLNIPLVIRQICKGVKYMHDNYIIHRDLKLQNVIFNNNIIKIGDYGCAVTSQGELRTTQIGSLLYWSPQQFTTRRYGKKKDIWGIGIIAYQLLLKTSPFFNQIKKYTHNQNEIFVLPQLQIPQNSKISKHAQNFLKFVLVVCPDKRPSLQQIIQHPFLAM